MGKSLTERLRRRMPTISPRGSCARKPSGTRNRGALLHLQGQTFGCPGDVRLSSHSRNIEIEAASKHLSASSGPFVFARQSPCFHALLRKEKHKTSIQDGGSAEFPSSSLLAIGLGERMIRDAGRFKIFLLNTKRPVPKREGGSNRKIFWATTGRHVVDTRRSALPGASDSGRATPAQPHPCRFDARQPALGGGHHSAAEGGR